MISYLSSPSVCLVDDEEDEYRPILNALIKLGVGCVHVKGGNGDPLPPEPFDSLRLVFTDLHLSGQTGKTAASHTANVIRKVIPNNRGPILVVIWSKYASDPAGDLNIPEDDQPTEAELFKQTLLQAEPKFRSRLLFKEMLKPKKLDRPDEMVWIESLKDSISQTLLEIDPFRALWTWESLLQNAGMHVSESLVEIAESSCIDDESVIEKLKLILKLLAQTQGGPDCSITTAFKHLLTVFSQIGTDAIETEALKRITPEDFQWLAATLNTNEKKNLKSLKLHSFIHTASADPASADFAPGTLYDVSDLDQMALLTGFNLEKLQSDCFDGNPTTKIDAFRCFKEATKPVFLEISPMCDFHQQNRRCATLIGGLIFSADTKNVSCKDSCKITPSFEDRFQNDSPDVGLVFCARHRYTTPLVLPSCLSARLRLRDSIVTELRAWQAGQSARVGLLAFT